jgi:ABC-type transport system involved in multi-copper enzyme maturation permease subunit
MSGILASEVRKWRRSSIQWVALASSLIPLLLSAVDLALKTHVLPGRQAALQSNAEIWALGSFLILVFTGCHIFSREYQDGTIQPLFTTPHHPLPFLFAKLLVILLVLAAAMLLSFAARFLGALLLASGPWDAAFVRRFVGQIGLYTLQFAMLAPWIALIGIVMKKMFSSLLVAFGFIVMLFPFHRTDFYWLFPHLVPVVHFSKTIGFDGSNLAFRTPGWISLSVFFVLTLGLCMALFRRR